jgi:hypothetical protein
MSLNDGAQMGLMLSFLHKSQMDSKTGLSSRRAQALELVYNSGDLGGQIIDQNQAFKE